MESDLRGIILDIDGTLIDSIAAHVESWRLALSEFGVVADTETIRTLVGMNAYSLLPASLGIEAYSVVGRAVKRRRREIYNSRFLPGLGAFPGARDLLCRLQDTGLTIVAVSASETDEAVAALDVIGASPLVDLVVTSTDEPAGIHDHDLVRTALRKSGLRPEKSTMVGDTPYDAVASQKAGVPFIGVLCGGWPASAFPNAIAVYESPAEILRDFPFPAVRTRAFS